MIIVATILLLYAAINLAEAWLEVTVIELKDPRLKNYRELNEEEHFRSLVLACLVAATFLIAACYFNLYWLLPALIVNRRICFDYVLKRLRKRDPELIEGTGPFDRLFKALFGADGGLRELAAELAITVFSILLTLKDLL